MEMDVPDDESESGQDKPKLSSAQLVPWMPLGKTKKESSFNVNVNKKNKVQMSWD